MMDGAIKNLVLTLNQYSKSPTEDLVKNLTNRIDAVITKTTNSCPSISPTELMLSECLLGVIDLLNSPKTPSKVISKVLLLLANFAVVDDIQHAMKHSYNLPATLASVIHAYSSKQDGEQIVLQCLQLLQAVTYNYVISYPSTQMEELVNLLINNISQPESELTLPSIGLLANLCRANVGVQMQIRAMPNLRAINKTLMRSLSNSDFMIIVCSLSTLTSLCFNDDLGEKLFKGQNINQTFQLIFNLLLHKEGSMTRQYTVDLFIDLMKYQRIQQDFLRFPHLDKFFQLTLGLLYDGKSKDICKIVEFFLAAFKIGDLRNQLVKSFLETGKSGSTNLARLIALTQEPLETTGNLVLLSLKLLEEIYQELFDSQSLHTVNHDDLINGLAHNLTHPITPENAILPCQRVTGTIRVINCICEDDALRGSVAAALDPQGTYNLVRHQLEVNEIVSLQLKTPGNSESCETGVEMMLSLLELMVRLKSDVPTFEEMTQAVFKDYRVTPFLAYGITSQSQILIHKSLHLFNCAVLYPEFPKQVLEEKLSLINQGRTKTESRPDTFSKRPNNGTTKGGQNGHRPMDDTDEKIDTLIDMMQSDLDLNGLQASGIMDVYEHKLSSLQTKQSHLEDLLEAKALALSQADRLIAQHRCQWAQADAEASKLRSFLLEAERCKERYKEELHEATLKHTELTQRLEETETNLGSTQNELDSQRELNEMLKRHLQTQKKQYEELDETETNLGSTQNELDSQRELNEMLKRHLQTQKKQYEEATTSFEESVQRKDKKLKELEGLLTKETDRSKKLSKENDDQEKRITQLQADLEKLEAIKKEKIAQLAELEAVSRRQDTELEAKEETIQAQKKELLKVQEMRRMIHQMTKTS